MVRIAVNRLLRKNWLRSLTTLGVVFLLASALGAGYVHRHLQQSLRIMDDVSLAMAQTNNLRTALMIEETAQRGYDLTGESDYLKQFRQGKKQFEQVAQALQTHKYLQPHVRKLISAAIDDGLNWQKEDGQPRVIKRQQGGVVSPAELSAEMQDFNVFWASAGKVREALLTENASDNTLLDGQIQWVFSAYAGLTLLLAILMTLLTTFEVRRTNRSERMLLAAQHRLVNAQRMANIGSFDWDMETDTREWSDEVYRIVGIQPGDSDLHQMDLFKYIHPDDHDLVHVQLYEAWATGRYQIEYRVQRPNGETRLIHVLGEVSRNRMGKPVRLVGVVQDVTDRKSTEEMMIQSEKLSVVGQLAAGVAHEVRNPLTALMGFTQLLDSAPPEAQASYIQIMLGELRRIELIVSELLVLSKPQVGLFAMQDALPLIRDVIQLLQTQAILKNIEVELEASKLPPIYCDANQVKQVLINVLKNAIEAVDDGGQVNVIASATEGGALVIYVKDNGYGIPEERLSRLGEPFYSTKEKGTGLGLMVSRKIIEHHGGRIRVTSQVGKGTTVAISIPLQGREYEPA